MKKADFLLTRSCLLILSVIVLFGFVSCGDDDIDKNNPTPPMSMINKSYDVTYTVKVTDPKVLSDIADLEIQYFDPEGELHIDTINSDNWSKKYFFEQHLGSKIGLKARWLFHDKAQLDKLVELLGSFRHPRQMRRDLFRRSSLLFADSTCRLDGMRNLIDRIVHFRQRRLLRLHRQG